MTTLLRDITSLRTWREYEGQRGKRIALVPTMGCLHAGHFHLVELAKKAADCVIVSIFLNPLQFGSDEDYQSYPCSFDQDIEQLKQRQVAAVFAPESEILYPNPMETCTHVRGNDLAQSLEGESRPGHFTGVLTIVAKLLNLVQAQVAVFGEKDYQQLQLIRCMVKDLNFPVNIVAGSTVRDSDGLALSSRNRYLDTAQRQRALALPKTLRNLTDDIRERQASQELNPDVLEWQAKKQLEKTGLQVDYVAIRAADNLAAFNGVIHLPLRILAAVYVDQLRLIDNIALKLDA